MNKIQLIIEKEFEEIMKNKIILFSILFMPLIFSVFIPMAMLVPMIMSPDEFNQSMNTTTGPIGTSGGISSMTTQEGIISFMVTATLPFFMMLPAMLPTIISSYSIIGEKKNRTLEPLLAAPISVQDIMIGKAISALVPALVATWIAAAIYAVVVWLLTNNIVHRVLVPDMIWLIGLFILGPLLAFLGVMITVIISARVSDPRTAQQISVVLILPLVGIFIAQLAGFMLLDTKLILIICVIVLVIDLAVIRIGSKLFDREEILTRWR
ncbi:ABC transporter permease subunit [Methanocella sp. MCL-LM]|uniref:ABC transporter permease subunit n=1 Tax=Methanocella sp. MCL-LM TaxID=3412035 RepID=UPI003C76C4CE